MKALHFFYTAETLEKLEKLAQLTEGKPFTAFAPRLFLLALAALTLASVNEAVQEAPLQGPEDLATFTEELDKAGGIIIQALDERFQAPGNGWEHLLSLIEEHGYPFSRIYLEKRARIRQAGKSALLARLSQKGAHHT